MIHFINELYYKTKDLTVSHYIIEYSGLKIEGEGPLSRDFLIEVFKRYNVPEWYCNFDSFGCKFDGWVAFTNGDWIEWYEDWDRGTCGWEERIHPLNAETSPLKNSIITSEFEPEFPVRVDDYDFDFDDDTDSDDYNEYDEDDEYWYDRYYFKTKDGYQKVNKVLKVKDNQIIGEVDYITYYDQNENEISKETKIIK